ncbi:MAG: sugar ABC transporter ATP-binding protein [Eubacteriales bacterium]|nr:sugar ABC transporter ATP-binding protein [Eubacteriales bacterium]
MGEKYYVEMKNVTKSFGGVHALKNVNFRIAAGKVNVLIGENGAGKSTLMKILAGAYREDSGQILIDGKEVQISSSQDALEKGIVMVYQELNLVPGMTVMDNMYLGVERSRKGFLSKKEARLATQELLDMYNMGICAENLIEELNVGKQQMIEIIKAVSKDAKVIIMDEPTSSLSQKECEELFDMINTLTQDGVAIVYISHRMEEIFRIGDYITVMRDGEYIGDWKVKDIDQNFLVQQMVGREISQMFPKEIVPIGDTILKVDNITKEGLFKNVSFELRRGEILGMAGLIGAGRTEVALSIFGRYKLDSGDIYLDGTKVLIENPQRAIAQRIAYVPEDRKGKGLDLNSRIRDNISISNMDRIGQGGIVNTDRENKLVEEMIEILRIKTPSPMQLAGNLSGGNQQKVVLAKWISRDIDVLILDEPTRGVDVGAKEEIHKLIVELARKGIGIIMISSELPEVLGMSDRILVMHEGRVTGILEAKEATQEAVMERATAVNK